MSPLIPQEAKLEKVFTGAIFSEGPASDRRGHVLFSDCSENIIYSFDESSLQTVVWSDDSAHANGMNFDAQGRLVACCDGKNYPSNPKGGPHAVRRYEKDGTITILADSFNGKKLNGPNDLCFDAKGRIYFTDPRYGDKSDIEQDVMAVYRIDLDGTLSRVIEDLESPNGILISKDNKLLFLVDHNPDVGGARTLVRYKGTSTGSWIADKVLLDFGDDYGMDGMVFDDEENIYVTGGSGVTAGVHIVSSNGEPMGFIPTPETPGNCTFSGPDLNYLYICASTSLYRIKLNAKGLLTWS
jgi:gluconolactonase